MSWNTISTQSVDLKQLDLPLIVRIEHEPELVPFMASDGTEQSMIKFYGEDSDNNPISFLATDHLSETIKKAGIPGWFLIKWEGKIELKGGKQFNQFLVRKWEGDGTPTLSE